MDLKVKLQKPINKKQEEKRKWTRKNAGIYKIYAINNFFCFSWRMEKSFNKGLGDVPPLSFLPPPFQKKY